MKTKKEIKEAYESGKCVNLLEYIISDGTKSDIVNALHLIFESGGGEYQITFESVPYSRGGKYKRHTSTLTSVQSWYIDEYGNGVFCIRKGSTSSSAACPEVIVPKFYTDKGKEFYNSNILKQISELQSKLLK